MNRWFPLLFIFLCSCTSEKEPGLVVSDKTMVQLARNNSSFTYFRNSVDTLKTDPQSEHAAYIRVRFNPRALSAMNDSASQLNGTAFPDESMIVKEMYTSRGGPMVAYVVMYKLRTAADNSYGWLWGEYDPDGTPSYSVSEKGARCNGCHLSVSNSDLVRTFSLH